MFSTSDIDFSKPVPAVSAIMDIRLSVEQLANMSEADFIASLPDKRD
jgi:hypothetical protein